MPKRISDLASSLRELGEVQVTDWDFKEFLNTDIQDFEVGRSLRKLGNRKVMEWDFRSALPAVRRIANQEVDVAGWVKRLADYKVIEWDFKSAAAEPERTIPDPEEMEELTERLRSFIQFVAASLIDQPARAELRTRELAPGVLRFRLVVTAGDQKNLVGRHGSTASAIRNLVKGIAAAQGVHALLEVLSHEEEITRGLDETGDR